MYRQRKGHAQALVTLTDSVTKKRRDYWLGEFGTPAGRERYHRVIAEWESLSRRLPDPDFDRPAAAVTTSESPFLRRSRSKRGGGHGAHAAHRETRSSQDSPTRRF